MLGTNHLILTYIYRLYDDDDLHYRDNSDNCVRLYYEHMAQSA